MNNNLLRQLGVSQCEINNLERVMTNYTYYTNDIMEECCNINDVIDGVECVKLPLSNNIEDEYWNY